MHVFQDAKELGSLAVAEWVLPFKSFWKYWKSHLISLVLSLSQNQYFFLCYATITQVCDFTDNCFHAQHKAVVICSN